MVFIPFKYDAYSLFGGGIFVVGLAVQWKAGVILMLILSDGPLSAPAYGRVLAWGR